MADEREVVIKIKSEYDGKGNVDAEKGLKKVEAQSKKTGETGKQAATTSGNAFEEMGKKIAASLISITAIFKVINFFKESSELAAENARAVNTLAAAYQAVGYTAQGAMKQAQDFATKMQNLTGIADEAFLNAQRLLANYGVVGTKAQEAVQAAYALSIGRSMDFASAMDLVARAAAGQTQTLSRYGIVLGDNVKEGQKFEAVLAQINERFGATAQAAMGDTITKTNALAQAWGDFKEQVGAGLNEGLAPILDGLTAGVGLLNKAFKAAGVMWGWTFDKIFTGIQFLKTGIIALAEIALKSFAPIVKVMSYLPAVGQDIKKAFDSAVKSIDTMRSNSLEQAKILNQSSTALSDIWKKEKDIVAENKEALALNEKEVNAKRNLLKTTEEIAKAEKKSREEQQKKLDNMGLSSSKDLKGWGKGQAESEPMPSDLEIAAGGGNALSSAADSIARYDAESERLAALYEEKRLYIEQEITDEQLKQEALTNLQNQYEQQRLANDKNTAKARQQVYASMWGALTGLASSSNKKVAAVGKVASVAQATMSMFTGAAKALELPFPANLAAVATVLAQGAALVEQIQAVKLAEGGLVKAVSGGVNTIIGEGGSDEAVLPLDNTRAMQRIGSAIGDAGGVGANVVVNINVAASGGVEAILEQLTEASRSGVVQALEFANLNYKVGQEQQGLSV